MLQCCIKKLVLVLYKMAEQSSYDTVIITCVTGNYKAFLRSVDHLDVDAIAFVENVDNVKVCGDRWKIETHQYFNHADPFMKGKFYKCNWHKIPLLDNYKRIIWIDATVGNITHIPDMVPGYDIIAQETPSPRTTIHEEIMASKDIRYRNYQKGLQYQMKHYPNTWLANTCFVVSERNDNVIAMNTMWFEHNLKYSPQDQVSFPHVCDETGTKVFLRKWCDKGFEKNGHIVGYNDYYINK